MDISELHKLIDNWASKQSSATVTFNNPNTTEIEIDNTESGIKPERTDGKRAVRTKSTGDRVYLIDDNAKTKAWITSPEIMTKLGFEMSDVQDLEDSELISYQMSPSIYRVE